MKHFYINELITELKKHDFLLVQTSGTVITDKGLYPALYDIYYLEGLASCSDEEIIEFVDSYTTVQKNVFFTSIMQFVGWYAYEIESEELQAILQKWSESIPHTNSINTIELAGDKVGDLSRSVKEYDDAHDDTDFSSYLRSYYHKLSNLYYIEIPVGLEEIAEVIDDSADWFFTRFLPALENRHEISEANDLYETLITAYGVITACAERIADISTELSTKGLLLTSQPLYRVIIL